MHVIFVAPEFPANQREFVRVLRDVGAYVTGIGERPLEALDEQLKSWLGAYEQVRSVCDVDQMIQTVQRIQARGWVDRLEATIESHILPAARVREATKIPGTSVETALLCRDKPLMKAHLRKHGIPCARSTGANSGDEVRAFADEVGYPIILKPRAGAGAEATIRVDDDETHARALLEMAVSAGKSIAVEEFVEGHEGFYDTLTVGGEVVHEFVSHYFPNVLEAMRTRWISPQIVVTNRLSMPDYDEVKALGRRVVEAMGLQTSATHMEWFFGPKGLRFSEIGARPPGVRQWDLYNAANDMDVYRDWAHAIAFGSTQQTPSRRYSSGLVALRPDRDGRISHYDGVDAVVAHLGDWLIDLHLPEPGTPTQPVEAGYMANAWVRVKHPDFDTLRSLLDFVGQTLKVRAR